MAVFRKFEILSKFLSHGVGSWSLFLSWYVLEKYIIISGYFLEYE